MTERELGAFVRIIDSSEMELKKMDKNGTFNFSNIRQEQLDVLKRSKTDVGILHRHYDIGQHKKPVDFTCIRNAPTAWVILTHWVPRKPLVFYFIEVDVFLRERESSFKHPKGCRCGCKVITIGRVQDIAQHSQVVEPKKDKSKRSSEVRERLKNRNDRIKEDATLSPS